MTRLMVHVASRGNGFMTDIATWITEATCQAGYEAQLVVDTMPRADGDLHVVVAPHEFFTLTDASRSEVAAGLASSILIGTEQPGTTWFEIGAALSARALAVADINLTAVGALRERGIDAVHLPLGAVASMIAPGSSGLRADRAIDVMFMGGLDTRRGAALAELAPYLAPHRSEIRCVISDRPLLPGDPGVVLGAEKYARLANTRILLNLHRDNSGRDNAGRDHSASYLEWVRLIEAMANRVVVITEPVDDYGPLTPGAHLLAAPITEMGELLADMLAQPEQCDAIAQQGFALVTEQMDLAATMGALYKRWSAITVSRSSSRLSQRATRLRLRPRVPRLSVGRGVFQPFEDLRVRAKASALSEQKFLRALDRTESVLRHGDPDHCEIIRSPAITRERAAPKVSVVITLYNYAGLVAETLHSVAASIDIDYEVLVIDDHSLDDSVNVAREALETHPDLNWTLVARSSNRGLAAARNLGMEMAAGEHVMIIDADNHAYPRCLSALSATLDATPTASATWSILEDFGAQRGLRSAVAWDPRRLCEANYLDAQSMWRRDALIALGGYRDDDDLVYGWEDWDLWLRLAHSGGHAVLHPEILGRYRVQEVSMIALTNLARTQSIRALRDRYPDLPWPAPIAL